MPSFCARNCNSQWPLETQTEQIWFRSVSNNSMIERRYFCRRSELGVTSMPSCTSVTQADCSFAEPFTSTRHKRHAPTLERPFNSQSVGRKILLCRTTSRMVSCGRALKSRSSILRVLTLAAGVIGSPPEREWMRRAAHLHLRDGVRKPPPDTAAVRYRSEERRVGKDCRAR